MPFGAERKIRKAREKGGGGEGGRVNGAALTSPVPADVELAASLTSPAGH